MCSGMSTLICEPVPSLTDACARFPRCKAARRGCGPMWTARGAGCGTLPGAHERGSAADAMVGPVPAWHREKKTAPPQKKQKKQIVDVIEQNKEQFSCFMAEEEEEDFDS